MTTDFPALPRRCVAVLLVLCMLASCVSVPKRDIADECARYRAPFERVAETWNSNIVRWTALGIGIGAIVGYLKNRSIEGIIAGGFLGGAAGAFLGYVHELINRAERNENIIPTLYEDSRSTHREIEELRSGLEKLNACRVRQIRSLKQLVASRTLDRPSARARLEDIRRWVAQDTKLVADVTGVTEQQARYYMGAYASVTDKRQLDVIEAEWKEYEPAVRGGRATRAASRSAGEVAYATTGVRLRAGPGTQHRILGTVPPGGEVEVLGRQAGWAEVRYRGRKGYISTQYLGSTPPGPAASSSGLPVVEAKSRRIEDPIRKVAYAQKELEVETTAQKEVVESELADLELLLRTQARLPAITPWAA